MSIIGTRPPLISETNFYELHHKLVQSVLSQTYEDYELILVDDSSKDNSYSLMKKYQEMDSRIKAYCDVLIFSELIESVLVNSFVNQGILGNVAFFHGFP